MVESNGIKRTHSAKKRKPRESVRPAWAGALPGPGYTGITSARRDLYGGKKKGEGNSVKYQETVTLKDGRTCILRNGTEHDGQALLDIFILTHTQTEFLIDYPDEITMTVDEETKFLKEKTESENEIELVAELDGTLIGSAGIWCIRDREKLRHRAGFGISIDETYWGLGLGRALTAACIACAWAAGYTQLELDVLADNEKALALYKSVGFAEYGRNPRGIKLRSKGYRDLVLMRLELKSAAY